jgi:O-antigen ligase
MLFGTFIVILCCLVSIFKAEERSKSKLVYTYFFTLIFFALLSAFFSEQITLSFDGVIDSGLNSSGRFDIYIDGIKQFLSSPTFGLGFYECQAFQWGINNLEDFLPARYHDTYVQLLASCGLFGLFTYFYHRYETFKLFKGNYNPESIIMFLSLFAFILISILDCHFFNLGPGFLYSALLLLAEKTLLNNKNEAV